MSEAASGGSEFRSRVCAFDDLTEAEIATWDRLCLENEAQRRAFLTPHFSAAVQRARGGVRVCVIQREEAPVAFFPFQFAGAWQKLLHAAEPVGGNMSDGFGLVAEPSVRATSENLLAAARLSACEVHHLCDSNGAFGLAAEEPECGLRVRFDSGWDAYWAALIERNKKFVQKTERRERNIVKEHGPLRLAVGHDDARAVLEDLIQKKREQYARTDAADALGAAWKRKLLHELALNDQPSCRGSLYTLHAGDTWVATHFGLQCGDVLHYWFPVYSSEVSKHSPGHLLLKAIGERSAELGVAVIDRGAGDTQAKRSFANEEQSFGRGRWSRPGGLSSTLYGAVRSVGWRLANLRARNGAESK